MIKKLLFMLLLIFSANAFAQIDTFPATESFDTPFTEGTDVAFIPNWTGNLVNPFATATRIFRDEAIYFSAPAALSIIPTSSFTGDVRVSLDMTSASSLAFSLKAKSMLNGDGTGTRNVVLTMETSLDAGTTWIGTQQIASLPNADQTDFADYTYALPAAANNQSSVLVRFKVTRGDGSGTAGKLIIDDVMISQSNTPQLSVDETAMSFTQVLGSPSPTHTVNVSGSNLAGNILLNTSFGFEISETENGLYGSVIALDANGGVVPETIIYVRMNAATAGNYTGTLTISSPFATTAEVALSGTATGINVTDPSPIPIYQGMPPIFTAWDPESTMGTFPEGMAFWTHSVTDPDLTVQFTEDWHCLYNLTNRSRFFGEGENGVSFVNTGNSQYTGVCDGTDPTQATGATIDNGRAGAIVLALSSEPTIGPESPVVLSADITWTARTILKNNRVYGLHMQYRIGDGNGNPNIGWTEFPMPQDYISGDDNTFQTFTTPLPAEAIGVAIEIRWVYYYISGSGSRAQLALDDIGISNIVLSTEELQLNNRFSFYPNPTNGNMIYFNAAADITISDISGKQIMKADNVTELNISTLSKGVYFIKNNEGNVLRMIR